MYSKVSSAKVAAILFRPQFVTNINCFEEIYICKYMNSWPREIFVLHFYLVNTVFEFRCPAVLQNASIHPLACFLPRSNFVILHFDLSELKSKWQEIYQMNISKFCPDVWIYLRHFKFLIRPKLILIIWYGTKLTGTTCFTTDNCKKILTQIQYLGGKSIKKSELPNQEVMVTSRHFRDQIDGLMQERRDSLTSALELRLSCTKPSKPSGYRDDKNIGPLVILPVLSAFDHLTKATPFWFSLFLYDRLIKLFTLDVKHSWF